MSVVPDLIRLSQVPVNYEQEIQTDLLEPVVQQEATATGTLVAGATGDERFTARESAAILGRRAGRAVGKLNPVRFVR